MKDFIFLPALKRYSSSGLLLLRFTAGVFLVWGMWDTAFSKEGLNQYIAFLAKFHFPVPSVMARLSAYAQLFIGFSFIVGLFTRWAGVLCVINFTVALIVVDRFADIRTAFSTACLISIGLFLAFHGAGRFGLDAILEPKSTNSRFTHRVD